ncbi:MAG: hypothetical protein F4W95_00865 [Chloroflexi bacterium]|nr:hypothetical protein [Chloroflexota bacterium]MYD47018.1 hypothetical protein [Chloroflexota bacterium]
MRDYALFINGIYQEVLDDIVTAQSANPRLPLYLQPYHESAIAKFREHPPSESDTVRLYASITTDLNRVHYACDVVGWRDKTAINAEGRSFIERELELYQPTEEGLYGLPGDDHFEERGLCTNLLIVMRMQKIPQPLPVEQLIKTSDNTPLGRRTTSGGWSYVHPVSQRRA